MPFTQLESKIAPENVSVRLLHRQNILRVPVTTFNATPKDLQPFVPGGHFPKTTYRKDYLRRNWYSASLPIGRPINRLASEIRAILLLPVERKRNPSSTRIKVLEDAIAFDVDWNIMVRELRQRSAGDCVEGKRFDVKINELMERVREFSSTACFQVNFTV